MSSVLKITVQGVKELVARLEAEQQNVVHTMAKAHTKAASEAVYSLKRGLSYRAGRNPKDKNYQNSPVGSLPYAHTMRLRNSIGFKVLVRGNKVTSEVGSGANGNDIEYAKYLQGNNDDGIRPFLDYVTGLYNPQTIIAEFEAAYKPLAGGKND